MGKRCATLNQTIKIWRFNVCMSKRRYSFVGEIIGEQKQDVRFLCRITSGSQKQPRKPATNETEWKGRRSQEETVHSSGPINSKKKDS
jgi:hypothetical protein